MKPTVYAPCANMNLSQEPIWLERRIDGQLWVVNADQSSAVSVRRCFPWTEPARFVSLRDIDDNEVAMIVEPAELDDASRGALEPALVNAGFVLEIVKIEEIDEEVEIRTWRVQTRQGERSFQTRLDDWPRELPDGGLLIRDVANDLYHVPSPGALDQRSRRLLWAFAD